MRIFQGLKRMRRWRIQKKLLKRNKTVNIRKIFYINMKVVLAYSGGLDTSVIVKWIKDRFNAEVVTFAANVGQGEELSGLAEKAKATGAVAHYTVDLQDEFVADFIYPMIRANAIYEGQYYLGTSIARPLIAKAQIEIARAEGADAVAHGATGKGQRPMPLRNFLCCFGSRHQDYFSLEN